MVLFKVLFTRYLSSGNGDLRLFYFLLRFGYSMTITKKKEPYEKVVSFLLSAAVELQWDLYQRKFQYETDRILM